MKLHLAAALLPLALCACIRLPIREKPAMLDSGAMLTREGNDADVTLQADRWWTALHDEQLNALVERSLKVNPDLHATQARLELARAQTQLTEADIGLQSNAGLDLSRQRLSDGGLLSGNLLGFNWYNQLNANLGLKLDFDWWGGKQAALQASLSREHALEADQRMAQLIVASALVSSYLQWQSENVQIDLLQRIRAQLDTKRTLQQRRVAAGIDAPQTLQTLEQDCAENDELQVRITGQQERLAIAIAVLAGDFPNHSPRLDAGQVDLWQWMSTDPQSLDLVARRPDIAASRWRVEAATEDVTQARASFYPDISLNAMGGLSSIDLAQVLRPANAVAGFGVAIHLPIFDAKRIRARHGISQAQLDIAVYDYNRVVLAAAQDVAAHVAELQEVEQRQVSLHGRLQAALEIEAAILARSRQGLIDARDEGDARLAVLRLQYEMENLIRERATAQVALLKALGGGPPLSRPKTPNDGRSQELVQ